MAHARSKAITLPAIVDLDALDPIRDELVDAIDSGDVTVRAGAVDRVATNALFMLLSAAETARRDTHAFTVSEPSEAFLAAISRLGLGNQFAGLLEG